MRKIKIIFLFIILLLIPYVFFGQACSQKQFQVDPQKVNDCGVQCNENLSLKSDDPYLKYQWHLFNNGDFGGVIGEDLHLQSTWGQGILGNEITVAVVDDGIDLNHPDLLENKSDLSWNFANPTLGQDVSLPTDPNKEGHGTCVAGLLGARGNNGLGVSGISPLVKIAGYNISGQTSVSYTAAATATFNNISHISKIDVSNNSYGPIDGLGVYTTVDQSWIDAIETGLEEGRSGLGTIYVWAAGNGYSNDRSNYDSISSFYGVIPVCAVGHDGKIANYSEAGSNLWVCGFGSSNVQVGLTTTDLLLSKGFNKGGSSVNFKDLNFTNNFSGTSAAAPVVSGVVSLILNYANIIKKELSWRDVKLILAKSARKSNDTGWSTNGAGYNVHDNYGFGIIDVDNSIETVKNWSSIKNEPFLNSEFPKFDYFFVGQKIPIALNLQNALVSEFQISNANELKVQKIEYLDVKIKLDHYNWGDLKLVLEHEGITNDGSVFNTKSILIQTHSCKFKDSASTDLKIKNCSELDNGQVGDSNYEFIFGTSKHLGESPNGTWRIRVYDTNSTNSDISKQGQLNGWRLKFYGS